MLQGLYTVAGLADADGSSPQRVAGGDLKEAYLYDAYGQVRMYDLSGGTPVLVSSSPAGNRYFFTGRELDAVPTGEGDRQFYHYRARAYDPRDGRFLQRDPAEYIDGNNLYEYAQSTPLGVVDPSGLKVIVGCADEFVEESGVTGLKKLRRAGWSAKTRAEAFKYGIEGGGAYKRGDVKSETVYAMLRSPLVFTVEDKELESWKAHVDVRLAIVGAARAKRFGFGFPPRFHERCWARPFVVRQGVGAHDALADLWQHPRDYRMLCGSGAQTVILRGTSDVVGSRDFDIRSRNDPYGRLWPTFVVTKYQNPSEVWIPGDWGFVQNELDRTNAAACPEVTRGENVIYVGDGKYWGHLAPDPMELGDQEWVALVGKWNSNAGAHWTTRRDLPRMYITRIEDP